MRRRDSNLRTIQGLAVLGLLFFQQSAVGAVIVSSWELGTMNHNSLLDNGVTIGFTTVQNPFVDSHIASSLPTSFAQAAYNFIWSELQASFQTSLSQQVPGMPPDEYGSSRTTALILVQPSVDSILSVTASYTYALPNWDYYANTHVFVRDMELGGSVWSRSHFINSLWGDPISGTVVDSNLSIPLTGGRSYMLNYDYTLHVSDGGLSTIGTGNGAVTWSINPAPEPSTLAFLAGALPLLKRRGRFSSSTCRPN